MNVGIICKSKYGSTLKTINALLNNINANSTDFIDTLKLNNEINFAKYDLVILASGIYYGAIDRALSKFLQKNIENITKTKFILLCNAAEKNKAKQTEQIKKAFGEVLFKKALASFCLGSAIYINKLSFAEKLLYKAIAKKAKSYEEFDFEEINKAAKLISLIKKSPA